MDPISAAASIVGLLSAASKTSELLANFVRRARSAPTLAQAVLSEVSDISACLSQLQRYLLGSKATSRSHDDLLSLEQIVVALSNCVLIFSELEEAIDFLKKEDPMRTIQIAQWMWKEQDIRLLLSRLKSSQVSLNLMLTTMTCTSSAEARCSVDKLGIMVQQVLESNHRLSKRMANIELRPVVNLPSIAPHVFCGEAISRGSSLSQDVNEDDESVKTMKKPESDHSGKSNDGILPTFGHTFDEDLNKSRPYTRAFKRQAVWSTTSSAVQTMDWSYLSGLSLADVSQISVIDLPISPKDLWNGQRYSYRAKSMAKLEGFSNGVSGYSLESSSSSRTPAKLRPISSLNFTNVPRAWYSGLQDQKSHGFSPNYNDLPTPVPKKIMLLGASLSGKATIYNHFRALYGVNFRDAERAKARDAIMDEIVEAFRWASRNINALSSNGYFVPVNSELRRVLDFATTNGEFSQSHRLQCYRALKTMWQNAEVRENLMCTEKTVINDNIPFYMDNIDEIATNVVADESLLRMRSNTLGIYNQPIMIDDVQCQIVDAGHTGVKWPDCSQALDSVIYVASLIDCYEQSSEGGPTNKTKELLANFELLTKMEEMRMVPIILLLNKADILESKLKEEPISDDHGWPFSDYMSACRHFSNGFTRLDKRSDGALRIQVTSAIDRIVFEKTLEIIKPIIIGNEKKHPLGRREISNPIFLSSTSKQDTIDLPSPSSHGLGYGSSKKRHEDVGNTITPPRSRDVSEEIHPGKLYGKSLVRRSSNILSAHPLLRSRAA